jgi:hypothetical protein
MSTGAPETFVRATASPIALKDNAVNLASQVTIKIITYGLPTPVVKFNVIKPLGVNVGTTSVTIFAFLKFSTATATARGEAAGQENQMQSDRKTEQALTVRADGGHNAQHNESSRHHNRLHFLGIFEKDEEGEVRRLGFDACDQQLL